jgi:hypothetical protein
MNLQAYFDDGARDGYFAVGGYVAPVRTWRAWEKRWQAQLKEQAADMYVSWVRRQISCNPASLPSDAVINECTPHGRFPEEDFLVRMAECKQTYADKIAALEEKPTRRWVKPDDELFH